MKHLWLLLVLLFPAAIFAQRFSALDGMEDQNGNTHLFYRIYNNIGVVNDSITNSVYHWNLAANTDSLYFLDYYYYENGLPHFSYNKTLGFKFFDNNPDHYIKWGERGSLDYYGYIKKYNNSVNFEQPNTSVLSVEFKDNETLYAGTDFRLAKSTDGGNSFQYLANSSPEFRFIKYDSGDKLFGNNLAGSLVVSIDEGKTVSLVDTNCSLHNFIYLDKNPLYKYRLINNNGYSKLMVSNNNGNAFSWSNKYQSNNKLYFAQDNNQQGSIYLADGKNILHSYDYGENWFTVWQANRNIAGLYKKSGTNKLYAATRQEIIEITSDSVRVIKRLPISANDLSYNPLEIGTKLIYNVHEMANTWPTPYDNKYKFSMEVVKDTTLANGKVYKQIRNIRETNNFTRFEYQRVDTADGIIYRFLDTDSEEIVEDLLASLGDTIYNKRMQEFMPSMRSLFNNTDTATLFGQLRKTRNYVAEGFGIQTYRLAQGIGIDSVSFGIEEVYGSYILAGMVKNGIVYGDTTMVTGVNDNKAVVNNYELKQNYPNPFNPSTTIEFSLAKGDRVEVTIYDILGNRVKTLFDGYKPAGSHSIKFDARNLTSGVYIYKVKSGSFITSKKMILVK